MTRCYSGKHSSSAWVSETLGRSTLVHGQTPEVMVSSESNVGHSKKIATCPFLAKHLISRPKMNTPDLAQSISIKEVKDKRLKNLVNSNDHIYIYTC